MSVPAMPRGERLSLLIALSVITVLSLSCWAVLIWFCLVAWKVL